MSDDYAKGAGPTGRKHTDEEIEEASQKAEAFDPALADELIFVIGELGVVVDPDRRLLVVSVPKAIDWDNDEQLTNAAASLIPAVADAMERRKEAK